MKFKIQLAILILFVSLFIITSIYSQETKTAQISYKGKTYELYPKILDILPNIPSPFTTEDGREIIVAITKNKKYALVDVTVENGKPYKYTYHYKGQQLKIDAEDFPALARTGLHSEIELEQTITITGKSIEEITEIGRPKKLSNLGFISHDEDIISVLKGDNRLVKKLGLTHPTMAKSLFHIWNLILKQSEAYRYLGRSWGEFESIIYNRRKIFIKAGRTKGWQESIFNDEIYGGCFINIWRELDDNEKEFLDKVYSNLDEKQMTELVKKLTYIKTGEIEPYYVMRYGFYEGHTDWRTDPIAIAFIFSLRSIDEIENAFKRNLYKALTTHYTKSNINN